MGRCLRLRLWHCLRDCLCLRQNQSASPRGYDWVLRRVLRPIGDGGAATTYLLTRRRGRAASRPGRARPPSRHWICCCGSWSVRRRIEDPALGVSFWDWCWCCRDGVGVGGGVWGAAASGRIGTYAYAWREIQLGGRSNCLERTGLRENSTSSGRGVRRALSIWFVRDLSSSRRWGSRCCARMHARALAQGAEAVWG